jgi:hypothetical protein
MLDKIRKSDLILIYEDINQKLDNKKNDGKDLNLPAFIKLSANYPELIDFFDIFNNKLIQNVSVTITRDQIHKIEKITDILKAFIQKMNTNKNDNNFTIAMKSFIDRANKLKMIPNNVNLSKNEKFGISYKMADLNSVDDEVSIMMSEDLKDEEDDEDEDEDKDEDEKDKNDKKIEILIKDKFDNNNDESKSIKKIDPEIEAKLKEKLEEEKNMETIYKEFTEGFEIFCPTIIKNEEYLKELADNGINLAESLIISNKKAFLSFFKKLRSYILELLFEYM